MLPYKVVLNLENDDWVFTAVRNWSNHCSLFEFNRLYLVALFYLEAYEAHPLY